MVGIRSLGLLRELRFKVEADLLNVAALTLSWSSDSEVSHKSCVSGITIA
jgi:hypothetical protein